MTIHETYFQDLASDIEALELETTFTTPVDYKTLNELTSELSVGLKNNPNPYRLDWSDLCTDVGRRLLDLSGLECDPKIQACGSAESYFLKTFQRSNVRSKHKNHSPIILTKEGEAMAFIKDLGCPTAYALQDDPDYDLFEGCIYDIQLDGNLPELNATTSWSLDIEEVLSITPARLSTLIIPLEARRLLVPQTKSKWEKKALLGQHEAITKMAQHALESATPLI